MTFSGFLTLRFRPQLCSNPVSRQQKKLNEIKCLKLFVCSAYEAEQRKKMFLGSGSLGAVSPGNTELTSVCYEYSSCYPDTHNKHNNNTAVYSIDTEHHYEQPMVVLPSRSPVDSIVKPLISDTSSSSTGGNT